MFDLDKALAAWRRSLAHDRTFLPEDLDELEQHVRDQVAALCAAGVPADEAFARAMREMGSYSATEAEYRKVYWTKLNRRGLLRAEAGRRLAMLRSYVATAARAAVRYRGYTFIHVSGLAAGLACCLLLFLFVRDERRYDAFHAQAARLYRVVNRVHGEDGVTERAATPSALGPALATHLPEVAHAVRFYAFGRTLVSAGDRQLFEENGFLADSTVFDVFTFPLVDGDAATALDAPNSVVLTETLARRLFGDRPAVGQAITLENRIELAVTGVMRDLPAASHLKVAFLGSFSTMRAVAGPPAYWQNWTWQQFYTYVLVRERADAARLQAGLSAFIAREVDPRTKPGGYRHDPRLQPLRDVHLHSTGLQNDVARRGSLTVVNTFGATAVLVLLVACFNFVNLSTARAASRAKEVGVRKVVGARRSQLACQFLAESALYVGAGMVLAVAAVAAALPWFNRAFDRALVLDLPAEPWLVPGVLGVALGVGLIAGAYPAFVLSAFHPVAVLKGRSGGGGRRLPSLRQVLVVAQFAICIALVAATLVVHEQLTFLRSRDLGFDEAQVVVLPLRGAAVRAGLEAFKRELVQQPGVVSASASWGVPGDVVAQDAVRIGGRETPFSTGMLLVDADYVETLGLSVVAGRPLSAARGTDAERGFLLNEAAVRALGWHPADALGQQIGWTMWGREDSTKQGTVVGVVKDFHVRSLHQAVEPVVLHVYPRAFGHLSVRIRPEDVPATLGALAAVWKRWVPEWPFDYTFLDAHFAAMYTSERQLGWLFLLFSGLAVAVACLGLFGLAAFSVAQRTKEVGVRKVLGASVPGLVLLFARDFIRLVLVAFAVAAPVAYLGTRRWLDGFAYRIDPGAGLFVLVGGAALLLALLTVGYHALRLATAAPARTLRYD